MNHLTSAFCSARLRQTWWRQQQMKAAQSACGLMRRGWCWNARVYDTNMSAIFDGRLQWNPHHQITRATSLPRCAPFPCNGTCLFQWTTFNYLHSSRMQCERTPKDMSFCKKKVYILCLFATASRPFAQIVPLMHGPSWFILHSSCHTFTDFMNKS